jgi:hypothetical protein
MKPTRRPSVVLLALVMITTAMMTPAQSIQSKSELSISVQGWSATEAEHGL